MQRTNFLRVIFVAFVIICYIYTSAGFLKPNEEAAISEKFKVFRITPKNEDEVNIIRSLVRSASEFQLNFWKEPTHVGIFSDVMVPPLFVQSLQDFLNQRQIQHAIIIEDVQRLMTQREKPHVKQMMPSNISAAESLLLSDFFSKRMKDDSSGRYTSRNQAIYGFGEYHSYSYMQKWLDDIERFYPEISKGFSLGTTHEGRTISGIKIGRPIYDATKRAVWIDGGIHAREWASVHTALYFIDQLISGYGVDPQITNYVNTLNFYIVPVANPDGFEYSRSDSTPQTRFWRKNRGSQVCKKDRWSRVRCCGGVDLNRNFDFHWGETGSSDDMCSDIYQGQSAFSEPESRAIRDKMLSPELNGKVDAFITLHTYSQMWIHPYNHERRTFPDDIIDLQDVGKRGVRAIEDVYGTKYRFGTGADILYPSAGGSDDWAKAHAHVKYVYLLELRPGEEEWDGFLLDQRQLVPTGKETWEGIKVVVDAVMKKSQQSGISQIPSTIFPLSTTFLTSTLAPPLPTTFPAITAAPTWFTQQIAFAPSTSAPPSVFPQISSTLQPFQTRAPQSTDVQVDRRLNEQNVVLRNSLHEKLAKLRQTVRDNGRKQSEHKRRQFTFWQNRQSQLNAVCEDKSQWCSSWIQAAPQICRTSTVYMNQDCKRSCGFCLPPTG